MADKLSASRIVSIAETLFYQQYAIAIDRFNSGSYPQIVPNSISVVNTSNDGAAVSYYVFNSETSGIQRRVTYTYNEIISATEE